MWLHKISRFFFAIFLVKTIKLLQIYSNLGKGPKYIKRWSLTTLHYPPLTCPLLYHSFHYTCTRTSGAYGPLVLAPAEDRFDLVVGEWVIKLSTVCFEIHNDDDDPKFFQFYHTFYHKPLPLLPSTSPTTFSVPRRNTGKCFERCAKILRGRQRFGDNLGGGGGGWAGGAGRGVLTIRF